MVIAEYLDRIQSLYARGLPSMATRLEDRLIYSKMLSTRKFLIAQQIKKRQKISDWNYIVLPCVELIKVPASECTCFGSLGCDIWRTKIALPKVLTDLDRHYIEYVMAIDNSMKIEETTATSFTYSKGNKYTKEKPKYYFENGHLYFPVQASPGIVKIKFLPEDPIEAKKYPSACAEDTNCVDCVDCAAAYDYEFPLDGELEEALIKFCVEELVILFSQISQDIHNNSKDDNANTRTNAKG